MDELADLLHSVADIMAFILWLAVAAMVVTALVAAPFLLLPVAVFAGWLVSVEQRFPRK